MKNDDIFLKVLNRTNKKKKIKPLKKNNFYLSDSWLQLRYKALKMYGAVCQCCGSTTKDRIKLHVDHIKPRSKYPELALDINNLQILCEKCNIGKSNIDETDWR